MNDQQRSGGDALTEERINAIATNFLILGDGDTEHDTIDWRGFARAIEDEVVRLAASPSNQPAAAPVEEMIRFCPECGRLGDIPSGYEACCPDWSEARIVPKRFAELCAETFKLCVNQPYPQAAPAPADEHPAAAPVARIQICDDEITLSATSDQRAELMKMHDAPIYAEPVTVAPEPADGRTAKPVCSLCGDSGYYVVDGPTSEADGHHPNLEPCDCKAELAAVADDREPVDEVLEIVASYGPYGRDINEGLRFQIVLADEVKRLRGLQEWAVKDAFGMARATSANDTGAVGAIKLPHWFDMFLTNVCEIPDRNSPDGEPDAIVATPEELRDCALNAIEQCVSYAAPVPAMAAEAVVLTKDQANDLLTTYARELVSKNHAAIYPAYEALMNALLATPQPAPAEAVAIPAGWVLVPAQITDAMIESAMEHHYGKRRVRQQGGAQGVAMTVNGQDWSGVDAMRRFWKGALAAASQPPAQAAPIDVEAMLRDCVPGGDICDPQRIADSIREWFDERAEHTITQEV